MGKEVLRLSHWLKTEYQPDIIQLTNSMFVGMAHQIKADLDVPLVCAMQGEDIFLDNFVEPYKSEVLSLLRLRAQEIDGFIATSQYYADFMSDYLHVPKDKIHIVRLGINTEGHGLAQRQVRENHFVVGYLARICPEKGLHLLVEALQQLLQNESQGHIKLKVAGYLGKRDRKYFEQIMAHIETNGLNGHFEYCGEVDREQKIDFINSLDVLSVPTVYRDPKGLFILEALANGVPAIQPDHGAFSEIIAATGGGLLFEPNSSKALAESLNSVRENDSLRQKLSRQGKEAVHQCFTANNMAAATQAVYEKYLS